MAWPGVRGKKETGVAISVTRTNETSHGAYRVELPGADRPAELTWQAMGPLRIADHTFVPPEMRGQGVGRALVDEAERWGKAHGADRLVVTTALHRADAPVFYERLGFEHTGRRYVKQFD
jgi:GNAT superfamily N-acetyltransferase